MVYYKKVYTIYAICQDATILYYCFIYIKDLLHNKNVFIYSKKSFGLSHILQVNMLLNIYSLDRKNYLR